MTRSPRRAADAVQVVAYEVLSDTSGPDIATAALRAAQAVVGADIAGYYSHEWRGDTTPLRVTPTTARAIIPYERVPTSFALAQHPGIRHLVRDQPTAPFRITDLIPDRLWQSSALASRMRPDWGRNQQLHLPVSPGFLTGESQVWVFARTASSFTDEDREVAGAIAPVLDAVARHLATVRRAGFSSPVARVLTPREQAVLQLTGEGLSSLAIGLRLGISTRTAQKHAEHIYRKLGVRSKADALRVGRDDGGAPASSGLDDPARR
jgi:DNA-binding CsgD family transcriptional regulator